MTDILRKPRKNRPAWVRPALFTGAFLAFAAGIVAWLVPVITGIPFFIVALVLLGMASERVRRWLNRAERRLSVKWRRRIRSFLRKVPSKRLRAMVRAGSTV